MGVAKVILNGTTLIDVTSDTVAASNLLSGYTATRADGESITGTYNPGSYTLQEKSGITPTESSQIIEPDSGYYGLSAIQIDAISSSYVGSAIDRRDETDLTASGATVTVPAGYYAEEETKTIASGSATTPISAIVSIVSISVDSSGLITATSSGGGQVTPTVVPGYISSGTAGRVSSYGSGTKQLTVQAAQTITPGTTDQTIASGKYLTGAQTIKGDTDLVAGNIKDGTDIFGVTGTFTDASTVSSGQTAAAASQILSGYSAWVDGAEVQGSIASQSAQTITPGTTDQTIASGKYLSGTQTILGDANLIASNIVNGVTIFGVTGTASISPTLQSKSVTPSGSTQVITADSGYDGLSSVTVDPVPVSVVGTTLVLPAGVITI